MSHQTVSTNLPPDSLNSGKDETHSTRLIRDRSVPTWAAILSSLFTFGTAVCTLALVVFALFLHQLVAVENIEIYAPILGLSALVPVLGIVLFELGHARSLAGYHDLRRRSGPIGGVIAAILTVGGLAMLHPLLLLPPLVGGALGWVISRPLARMLPRERAWNALPEEAASVLSGRDQRGLSLLMQRTRRAPTVDALSLGVMGAVFIASFALASWLCLRDVLVSAAIAPTALISAGISRALFIYWRATSTVDPEYAERAAHVQMLPPRRDITDQPDSGLWVDRLSVQTDRGQYLLHDLSFQLPEGCITALIGDSFSGKSLLMRALSAPLDMTDLQVEGNVRLNGLSPWMRSASPHSAAIIHLPATPLILPDSSSANLLHPTDQMAQRAEYLLKSLLHNADTTRRILQCRNAQHLSHSEQKILAFVRAFSLRPALYLLDRPEDGLSEVLRNTLLTRLKDEARRGASILLVTEDRAMLEACDYLISLQSGRLVEMAAADEMRARASSGWQRFVATRELESEDALDSWINAQFRRDGDGANRRAVCMVANEMLTLACRSDDPAATDTVCFEIKLFAGRCQLRMQQPQPLSSGALQRAEIQATNDDTLTDAPLARVLRDSLAVENTHHDGQHWMEVSIEIYDPRKVDRPPQPAARSQKNVDATS